jgi:serine/threonine-protein kinase HipA
MTDRAALRQLDVYFGDHRVGSIYDLSPLAFAYAHDWLNRADSWPILGIPLKSGDQSGVLVEAVFENLLPEGELRSYITAQKKASSLFSLLLAVAGDTAGSFVILPSGHKPTVARYQKTSWAQLAASLHGAVGVNQGWSGKVSDDQGTRISLAGAQEKASVAIFTTAESTLPDICIPYLPLGTAPSTHILKPNIRRLSQVWHSAANETIVMLTAANCGLPTAEVFYEPKTQSCVVTRFDRWQRPDGSLGRIMQYDFCQLSGLLSTSKYESEGGPSLVDCAALIRRYSSQPAVDLKLFIQWLLFNLYVGNNDSHAKNISIYQTPAKGVVLTPFYDLMCTRIYPALSANFAFSIGGETKPGAIGRAQIIRMASEIGVSHRFVLSLASELAAKIPKAIDMAVESTSKVLPVSAAPLVDRLTKFVLTTTKQTLKRIHEIAQ